MSSPVRSRAHPPYPPAVRERTPGLGVCAPAPTTWRIDLTDTGGTAPTDVRLRRLLKDAGRRYGLRCVSIAETTPAPSAPLSEAEAEQVVQAFDGQYVGTTLGPSDRVSPLVRCSVGEDSHKKAGETRTSAAAIVRTAK